jgi:hypothetical protein
MGKFIGYAFLLLITLFLIEWLQIIDVPFIEIPDYLSGKKEMIDSTKGTLDQMK